MNRMDFRLSQGNGLRAAKHRFVLMLWTSCLVFSTFHSTTLVSIIEHTLCSRCSPFGPLHHLHYGDVVLCRPFTHECNAGAAIVQCFICSFHKAACTCTNFGFMLGMSCVCNRCYCHMTIQAFAINRAWKFGTVASIPSPLPDDAEHSVSQPSITHSSLPRTSLLIWFIDLSRSEIRVWAHASRRIRVQTTIWNIYKRKLQ